MNNYWKAIICLSILSLGLIAYIIFGKRGPEHGSIDAISPLRDSIALVEKQRMELETRVVSLNASYDSLLSIKQTVIIKYHDKIKFLSGASPAQLDSTIRAIIH